MTTERDWAAAKAAMLGIAGRYFGEIPRDRKVRCRFHEDRTPSMVIYDNGWHCYGCNEGGDAIDLVQRLESCTRTEAYDRVMGGGLSSLSALPPPAPKPRDWDYVPGAEGIPTHWALGAPTTAYPYYRDGQLVGLACRWDYTDGRDKDIRPASSVRDKQTGELRWEWVAMEEPRPLYRPDTKRGKLVIVEGEKCADHLRSMGIEACTWAGGASAIDKADWTMVQASRVYIWPDKNTAGLKAADRAATILTSQGVEVFMVPIDDLPDGHDAANITDKAAIIKRIKSSLPPVSLDKCDQEPEAPPSPSEKKERPLWPFKPLGHRNDKYYFWVHSSQRIIHLGVSQFNRISLLQLAPGIWWESQFAGKGGRWDLDAAAEALMSECDRLGVYGAQQERGRGIWWDEGRIVYHHGNGAIVDGEPMRLSDIPGERTYPIAERILLPSQALTDEESEHYILNTFRVPSWHEEVHGDIVAGWTFCAMLTGVLKWRPSVWVNAAAGSGKSEVLGFVKTLLGRFAEDFGGNSTEAGLRQLMGKDARAFVLDEAEPGHDTNQTRIKSILTLLRQASSDSSSKVARGTVNGEALTFSIRSPFLLSSIQMSLNSQADRERVTLVSLKNKKAGEMTDQEQQEVYSRWLAATSEIPDDIGSRFLGRVLALAGITRDTIKIMSGVLRHILGNQREADQIGALMSGAWLLQSSSIPTESEAQVWVGRYDWLKINEAAHETDAERARSSLWGMMTMGDGGERATVADRIAAIMEPMSADKNKHAKVLAWYGLRVFPEGWLFVSNRNDLRRAALKDTGFVEVAELFRQLAGNQRSSQRVNGETHRGVLIPLHD
jgi:putative DNA primase/helicase